MKVIHSILLIIHILAAGGWFGAMLYSLVVLQRRARLYFQSVQEEEEFIAVISQGARWKVLAALGLIGGSGAALVWFWPSSGHAWWALVCVKAVLFAMALVIFCHASWRLWPRRIFAADDEIARIRRRFRIVGISLIVIAALASAIGVLMRS